MKFEVHIDRLVVDAGSGERIERDRLARALSQALAQRFGGPGSQPTGPGAAAQGQRLEHRIAAAVHQAIQREQHGQHGGRP
jgi:hypothetical protein